MLSIIIPHHTEPIEKVEGLFGSIETQLNINYDDLEVIVINDNKDHILNFDKYPKISKNLKQLFNKQMGYPGISRQIGIDNSQGEYIMFCDADDQLFSSLALYEVFYSIKSGLDLYNYKFMHEILVKDTGNFVYNVGEGATTWLFAKAIRKQFLTEHDIRFSNVCKWHEDTYFNEILNLCQPKTQNIESVLYIWRCNLDSVTRQDNFDYRWNALNQLIFAHQCVIDWAKEHNVKYPGERILQFIAGQFTNCNCLVAGAQKYRAMIEKSLAELIKHHNLKDLIFSQDAIPFISAGLSIQNERYIPQEGFYQFIERLLEQNGVIQKGQ